MAPKPPGGSGRPGGAVAPLDLRGAAALLGERGDDVRAALLVALERDDLLLGGLLEELREGRIAVVRLVEGGVLADHRLLDHGTPERLLVLALQRLDGVDELGKRLRLLLRQAAQDVRLLRLPDQVLVKDELVAVADQEFR